MKIEKGLPKSVYGMCGMVLLAAAVSSFPVMGESLWEPGFSGYLSPEGSLEVGDVLLVEISPRTELTLQSTHIDSEDARLSFTGGEGQGLFDFLPKGASSSERELEEEDSYELQTRMAVRITETGAEGLVSVRGERSIEINGLRERILLSGKLSPSAVRSGRPVPFDRLVDAELSYSGVGYGMRPPLSEEDLEEIAEAAETALQEADEQPGQDEQTGRPAQAGTEDGEPEYRLSQEKRKELLVEYINRFIDVLFSQ